MALPHFFVIGAPKAGTTALHAGLATHPELFLVPSKEPKYYLCGDAPPVEGQAGPGDAHSAQEWIWDRDEYLALFDRAPEGALRGESTPFYLWHTPAHARIRRDVPAAKLIAVLRDPVDRAYSNWMHLWSDGLEPIPNFVEACAAEEARIAAGFAPFWHYRGLGRYAKQLTHLFSVFPRDQVHVLRYRDLVDEPQRALDEVCAFLGVEPGLTTIPPPENMRPFVRNTLFTRSLARTVRTGAALGAYFSPEVWRFASRPLTRALHSQGTRRPRLTPEERREVLEPLVDDIRALETLLDQSFSDWLGDEGRGDFASRRAAGGQASTTSVRRSWEPSSADAS